MSTALWVWLSSHHFIWGNKSEPQGVRLQSEIEQENFCQDCFFTLLFFFSKYRHFFNFCELVGLTCGPGPLICSKQKLWRVSLNFWVLIPKRVENITHSFLWFLELSSNSVVMETPLVSQRNMALCPFFSLPLFHGMQFSSGCVMSAEATCIFLLKFSILSWNWVCFNYVFYSPELNKFTHSC